jgi:predicted helicase
MEWVPPDMPMPLRELLEKYRNTAKSEREKGTYFEKKVWLETAPAQREQFSRVLFAREHRIDGRDTGVDLVAQLADSPDDRCAAQCKFYATGYHIQKADIASFFPASGRRPFTRRIIVDSTATEWSEHAEAALIGQTVETILVSGVAHAVAKSADGKIEAGIDWKSDVEPSAGKIADYQLQLGDCRKQTGGHRALLVLITPGKILNA